VIAVVGWLDDARGLPAPLRIVCHAGAATWALYWLGGLGHVSFGSYSWSVGALGVVLGIAGIVGAINAYNFMDGIDGLAASEALVVGSVGGGLLLGAGEVGLAFVALLIATAAAGFLPWNWQPAKIFMGDVGSGLLGFYFASLAVASERSGSVPLVVWVILLGVFACDATVTLVRRFWRRERWYEAHRSHAYQRLVQAGWSHAKVGWVVGALNLGLGALAWIGWRSRDVLPTALVVSAVCLTAFYLWVERICPMERLGTRLPG
jgi:Fuc2NAc and GlcNAc transferase